MESVLSALTLLKLNKVNSRFKVLSRLGIPKSIPRLRESTHLRDSDMTRIKQQRASTDDGVALLPTDPNELKDFHFKSLKPKKDSYDRLVGKGLTLRVNPSGKITFRYTYRTGGERKQNVITIGSYPAVKLKDLRAEYYSLASLVAKGEHPAAQKQQEKAEKRKKVEQAAQEITEKETGQTVKALIDLFQAYIDNPNSTSKRKRRWAKTTRDTYAYHLNHYFYPKFGNLLVKNLDARDISAWLGELAVNTPYQSNRILAALRVMFDWASEPEQDYMEINIAAGIKSKGAEQSKTRALDYNSELEMVIDSGEIKRFWNGMDNINPLHRMALQMMLLTGQRSGEVCGAKWEHIVGDLWVLPAAITKNTKVHKIPINKRLREHIEAIREISGGTPFLFPLSVYQGGNLFLKSEKGALKVVTPYGQTRTQFPDIAKFTPHDLRRTTATHLKSLGANEFEIGSLLNHSFGGVTGIYARGTDTKTLDKWHRQLDKILMGEQADNVVNF